MSRTSRRKEKLFRTAARLFYRQGYRATGVDEIASASGIGKMTLYRHFSSKQKLVEAYLRDSDEEFWRHFELSTRGAADARGRLLAFFQALQDYVLSPACLGCPFLNASSEYPQPAHWAHRIALAHKQSVRSRLRRLAARTGEPRAKALADALLLLVDGAYSAARMYGPSRSSPAVGLAEAARRLIDAFRKS
jgi:AcrR family transcriptional regulator